ncbi:glycerophosphodiester phosphodiesterase [Anaerostipes sp.]|uniref:glycerophosphodiester phosphodiesterase n=1 Tax=Anaerostipes sp. TaxID=1872530 RepID=UPI0025B87B7A|nr:glycerophosphodiester phosphodiesterase [Anaerostipes sp.]MBS7007786.1 glycerophosphodiester phosphodiesterase [Anaerostipes sp.]
MKRIKSLIIDLWKLLTWNWPVLLSFEVIYRMGFLAVISLSQNGIEYAMEKAGIEYLTNQSLFQLLSNPFSLGILVLSFAAVIYFSFMEVAAIVMYCDRGIKGEKLSVRGLFLMSAKKAGTLFLPKNLWIFLLLILAMPVMGISVMSGPVGSFKIPGFIMEFIQENLVLSLLYGGIVFILIVLFCRWIFCIHEFVLNRLTFRASCQKSAEMIKGRKIKSILSVLCILFVVGVTASLVYIGVLAGMMLAVRFTAEPGGTFYAFWYHYHNLSRALSFISALLRPVLLFGAIAVIYYRNKGFKISIKKYRRNAGKKLFVLIECAAVIVIAVFYVEMTMPYSYETPGERKIQVVAHRAGAKFAPENTIAAIREAVKSGADSAEIDVQQTKDGELVVMHDTNFQRTAGVKKNVWDVTLKEAKTFDMGSFFNVGYRNERVPALGEMIKAADGQINLMIELKSSGHEKKLEEKTVELIHRYGFEKQCSIASMDYRILQKVKKLDPKIPTVYIAAIAYGDMEKLKAADMISVEETFVNTELIARAKLYGKKVYAWTVNKETSVQRMRRIQVDGIVTDNVYYTNYMLEEGDRSYLVNSLAEKLLGKNREQGKPAPHPVKSNP